MVLLKIIFYLLQDGGKSCLLLNYPLTCKHSWRRCWSLFVAGFLPQARAWAMGMWGPEKENSVLAWVAVKKFSLSCYNPETLLSMAYPYYGNVN